jgi:dTDP-4-dehydrorhamnose 3,5-epimerase
MIFSEAKLPGVYVVDIERRDDARGFFARAWCQKEFEARGLNTHVAQANVGFGRKRGCVRGMHFQLPPSEEVKIVRCTMGAVCDVVVDTRRNSPTHKHWIAVELTAENRRMLYVPEGCAHGYQTLVDDTEIYYQTSKFYAPEAARGVRYDDSAFGIQWPLPVASISEADQSWPDYEGHFEELSTERTKR